MLSERMKEIYQSPQDLVVWVASWIDEVAQLEKALKYCQDDKEVMQNEIDVLKAELAAHRENEGDECPLCACEAQLQQAQDEVARLEKLYTYAVNPCALIPLFMEMQDYFGGFPVSAEAQGKHHNTITSLLHQLRRIREEYNKYLEAGE